MKPWSWQVMEGQALLCPCLSLRCHIFLTSYVNVCESEQSQGLQLPRLPHLPDLASPMGKCSEAVVVASVWPLPVSARVRAGGLLLMPFFFL